MSNAVSLGRAYVRIVEAAEYILERKPPFFERMTLRLAVTVCRHNLRGLVAELPAEISAEILAASENMTGLVKGFTWN